MKYSRLSLMLLVIFFAFTAKAEKTFDCSLSINQEETNISYKKRGSYCEGVYRKKYSNNRKLNLVGYHVAPFKFIPETLDEVSLTAVGPEDLELYTTINDNISLFSYRRDERIKANTPSTWSLEIISDTKVALQANQLLGLACYPKCFESPEAYFPVRVSVNEDDKINNVSPLIFLELSTDVTRIRIRAFDPETKELIINPETNQPMFDYTRNFRSRKPKSIERFKLPVLSDYTILEVDAFLEGDAGVNAKTFLIGANSQND